jgi:hypothetical protein
MRSRRRSAPAGGETDLLQLREMRQPLGDRTLAQAVADPLYGGHVFNSGEPVIQRYEPGPANQAHTRTGQFMCRRPVHLSASGPPGAASSAPLVRRDEMASMTTTTAATQEAPSA